MSSRPRSFSHRGRTTSLLRLPTDHAIEAMRSMRSTFGLSSSAGIRMRLPVRSGKGPVRRSFDRNPAFRVRLAAEIRREDIHSRSGVYLGSLDTFRADPQRINRVLEKHVRGLAYCHYGDYLSEDVVFAPYQLVGQPTMEPIPEPVFAVVRGLAQTVRLGDSVSYRYGKAADEPSVSAWLLQYFGRMSFLVVAGPGDLIPPTVQSRDA
jgi:hypothetical protein